jgi:hypothetical protein
LVESKGFEFGKKEVHVSIMDLIGFEFGKKEACVSIMNLI